MIQPHTGKPYVLFVQEDPPKRRNLENLEHYRSRALQICTQALYPSEVRERIKKATTEIQIEMILLGAAKGMKND